VVRWRRFENGTHAAYGHDAASIARRHHILGWAGGAAYGAGGDAASGVDAPGRGVAADAATAFEAGGGAAEGDAPPPRFREVFATRAPSAEAARARAVAALHRARAAVAERGAPYDQAPLREDAATRIEDEEALRAHACNTLGCGSRRHSASSTPRCNTLMCVRLHRNARGV
jgi:hypothetical protein